MNYSKRFLSTIVKSILALLLVASVSYSQISIARSSSRFPNGCRTQGVEARDGLLVFKPKKEKDVRRRQTLYFVHNISNQMIQFAAKKSSDQPFTPPYKNAISPNRWGAFATDMKEIAFTCMTGPESAPNKVPCKDVLEVCQYSNVKFSSSNGGNYWVVKSDSLQGAIRGAIHIGILLRW